MLTINNVCQDNGMDIAGDHQSKTAADFHFILVTYGKCVYWIDDKKIIMGKGDAVLVPTQCRYYWKSVPTVFHSKYVISFSLNGQSGLYQLPILSARSPKHSNVGCFDLIYERVKKINDQWTDKTPYFELHTSAILLEVMVLWNKELDRGYVTSDKIKQVEKMKSYIREHYRTKVTKDHLADVIDRSPNHTASLFKSITGQTISEYVHAVRIKTALYMLRESNLSIGEISVFLGYSDVSFFYKMFKGITGETPSSYIADRPRTI